MELRVIQNAIINPGSPYPKFIFIMGIFENKKEEYPIELNKIKAQIRFEGGDIDKHAFESPFLNLFNIFRLCYTNAINKAIIYKEECLTFAQLFIENYQELAYNHKENIRTQINQLEKQLNLDYIVYDLKELVDENLIKKIKRLEEIIDKNCNELYDYKETSDSYLNLKNIIDKQKDKLYHLKTQLNKTNNTDE